MRKFNRMVSLLLSLVMVLSLLTGAIAASYQDDTGEYVMEKISHPGTPVRAIDGIVDYMGNGVVAAHDQGQGARGQSYSWSALGYGDYVYLGTCYNALVSTLNFMGTVLGNNFEPETMKATLDVLFNGHFYTGEEDGANTGGVLLKMNVKTGEVTVLMSKSHTGDNALFRNACMYKDKMYFCGSINGLPSIYQVDPTNDEITLVYQGMTQQEYYQGHLMGISTGVRGLCEFNGQLVVSCVGLEGAEILVATEPWKGQEAFTQIADQEDLFDYPAYRYQDSIYGGSIWEIVEYNDSLYVSICTGRPENMLDEYTMQSFALVRGDQNEDGSWTWTSVIGDQKKDGARYSFGIDPQRTRAGAGVLYVYDNYLYIGEYQDEEIPLEEILFDLDPTFMNENLKQSVSLYRMDENENIELVVGDSTDMFPQSLSGIASGFGRRENLYIWRMNEFNGKLYVGTFDTSSLLEPFGQFVNGDLIHMSLEEWCRLLNYIRILLELQLPEDLSERLQGIRELLDRLTNEDLFDILKPNLGSNIQPQGLVDDMWELLRMVKSFLEMAMCLKDAERGFDLYVSEDGVNFKTITTNGFGDPYNHGLRVYANTDAGMVIGTANPFYGTQLWMLDEAPSVPEIPTPSEPVEPPYEEEVCPSAHLVDVLKNGWYHEAVDYCVENGIMIGVTSNLFGVDMDTTRAQLVTMLWRQAGEPKVETKTPFTDIQENGYYVEALNWAYATGVIKGVTATSFAPDAPVLREQIAAILYRYVGNLGLDTSAKADLSVYPDGGKISGYAVDAVSWAVAEGLIEGLPAGDSRVLNPHDNTTRAQIATIFMRYCEKILK